MDFQFKRYFYTVIFLMYFSSALAADFVAEKEDGKVVSLRGFLYRVGSTEVFLSPQPNLRSCCFENSTVEKIHLKGNFPDVPSSRAVEVVGRLQKEAGRWQLTEAVLMVNPTIPDYAIVSVAIGLFSACLLYTAYKLSKKN